MEERLSEKPEVSSEVRERYTISEVSNKEVSKKRA